MTAALCGNLRTKLVGGLGIRPAVRAGRPVRCHSACEYGRTTLLRNIVAAAAECAAPGPDTEYRTVHFPASRRRRRS
jgi:hypothetical protein